MPPLAPSPAPPAAVGVPGEDVVPLGPWDDPFDCPPDEGWVLVDEPCDEELDGEEPDELCGPPGGEDSWVQFLTVQQYQSVIRMSVAAGEKVAGQDAVGAGFTHRDTRARALAGEV